MPMDRPGTPNVVGTYDCGREFEVYPTMVDRERRYGGVSHQDHRWKTNHALTFILSFRKVHRIIPCAS